MASEPLRSAAWEEEDEDLDLFWQEAVPEQEPIAWRPYLPLILLLLVLNVPWYLSTEGLERILFGLPLFAWIALATSLGLSCVTSWAALRHWLSDDPSASRDNDRVGKR